MSPFELDAITDIQSAIVRSLVDAEFITAVFNRQLDQSIVSEESKLPKTFEQLAFVEQITRDNPLVNVHLFVLP